MDFSLCFEDIEIGQTWLSPGRTVTETDVVNFASHTGDFNPLHVDAEYAAKTIYRRPIAHGLLGISWAAGLGSNFPRMQTLAFLAVRDWEFLRPVYVGDTVHLETTVLDKLANSRRSGKVAWSLRLFNQKDELVQQGVFETIVAQRRGLRDSNSRESEATNLGNRGMPHRHSPQPLNGVHYSGDDSVSDAVPDRHETRNDRDSEN